MIGSGAPGKAPAMAEAVAANARADTPIGRRDRAILLTGFAPAMRWSELVAKRREGGPPRVPTPSQDEPRLLGEVRRAYRNIAGPREVKEVRIVVLNHSVVGRSSCESGVESAGGGCQKIAVGSQRRPASVGLAAK
jgi:hypothetical protein